MAHDNFRRMQALDSETSLGARTLEGLRGGVRAAGEWHDEIVAARCAIAPVACKAGCSSCCWLPASASFAELAHLAAFVLESFDAESLAGLKARLRSEPEAGSGPARAGDSVARRACALLVDGLCSAHAARPLSCRGWSSFDLVACLAAYDSPEAPPSIPVDSRVHGTARAMGEGMRDGARSIELDDSLFDLRLGLGVLLEDLGGWIGRWYGGERLDEALHGQAELPVRLEADGRWRTVTGDGLPKA